MLVNDTRTHAIRGLIRVLFLNRLKVDHCSLLRTRHVSTRDDVGAALARVAWNLQRVVMQIPSRCGPMPGQVPE